MKHSTLLFFIFIFILSCRTQVTEKEGKKEERKEKKKNIGNKYIELKGGRYAFREENIPITLSPFAINAKETTYGEMEDFALANKLDPKKYCDKEWGDEPDRDMPAVGTDWFDAIRYANWLSIQSGLPSPYTIYGEYNDILQPTDPIYWRDRAWERVVLDINKKGYRLPTEVEWEYAASSYEILARKQKWAGTDELQTLKDYAWYRESNATSMHSTASLEPNPLGIYDMSGNVREWCFDEYSKKGFINFKNVKNPFWHSSKKPSDTFRTLRGGSAYDSDYSCVIYARKKASAWSGINNLNGFRLCRTL